ncbi:hypothetical protein [Pedobacter boryungensis]|uniref:Uncharacterized protein n=1 Tax=Pedobacter boryungensis TaxID=869962 RepID=A0ABX2DAP6_9SPHI|nr:hypothetical protein [Pedobacter boryungensis]NQX31123.1 hypothetical protein [Pedobacter boryungensis]
MAFNIKKNLSLIATVAVILIIAMVGYYLVSLKKAPYPVTDFESFTYKWGVGDTLSNSYSSTDGNYQYINNRDSVIKTHVKLRANDMIFIHNKINELGLWNLPEVIGKKVSNSKSPVYDLQFYYKEKSKRILIYSDFEGNIQLLDSAMQIKNIVQQAIDEVESRYNN